MIELRPLANYSRSLGELSRFLGVAEQAGETVFTGVSSDSRSAQPGDLFIAVPGAKQHGASYIDQLISLGVVALLTDRAGAEITAGKLPTLVIENPSEKNRVEHDGFGTVEDGEAADNGRPACRHP